MITHYRHTGIVVNDLSAALAFYQDLLGFKITRQMEEEGEFIDGILGLKSVRVTTVKMKAGGAAAVELLHYHSHPFRREEPRKICSQGITHIALTVDNLDADYQRLQQAGIKFNSAPRVSDDGRAKVAFCQDPEGNFIELVEELS